MQAKVLDVRGDITTSRASKRALCDRNKVLLEAAQRRGITVGARARENQIGHRQGPERRIRRVVVLHRFTARAREACRRDANAGPATPGLEQRLAQERLEIIGRSMRREQRDEFRSRRGNLVAHRPG